MIARAIVARAIVERRVAEVILLLAMLLSSSPALAQREALAQRTTLDTWIALRLRDVQLLPDSSRGVRSTSDARLPPRVESTREGEDVDTLLAMQIDARSTLPSVRVGARVRLGSSSGAISAVSADVRARRLFRAPAKPIMAGTDTTWRYGWAYLLTTSHVGGKSGAAVYRGWLLFVNPDSTRRSPGNAVSNSPTHSH